MKILHFSCSLSSFQEKVFFIEPILDVFVSPIWRLETCNSGKKWPQRYPSLEYANMMYLFKVKGNFVISCVLLLTKTFYFCKRFIPSKMWGARKSQDFKCFLKAEWIMLEHPHSARWGGLSNYCIIVRMGIVNSQKRGHPEAHLDSGKGAHTFALTSSWWEGSDHLSWTLRMSFAIRDVWWPKQFLNTFSEFPWCFC